MLALYVGTSVGSTVGALLGEALGLGVGLPATYVGACVGEAVGAVEGDALGSGVGAATLVNVTVKVDGSMLVVFALNVTVVPDTFVTTVLDVMPVVAETEAPTAIELATDEDTVTDFDEPVEVTLVLTV